MYIDKIIKKEFLTLLVCVIVLIAFIIGISYSKFFSFDESDDSIITIGDLNISFCNNNSCDSKYDNYGQVIGMKNIDGKNYPKSIYPYREDSEALLNDPYIFNIKNTGLLDTFITVRLKQDEDYVNEDSYLSSLNIDYLKVGISNCSNGINLSDVNIYKYNELIDEVVLNNDELKSNEDKTYCLWTWLDSITPNDAQNTYFVANLSFDAEYIPQN